MADVRVTAKHLYGLPADEFVTARNREVTAARTAGDTALAKALGSLRKPSVGAAAVNQLVRSRPSLIEDVLELGVLLRAAQPGSGSATDSSGAGLRRLADDRRTLVSRAVREARALAREDGRRASSATLIDLEDTIRAALADETAALALRDGMLLTSLSPAGFGGVDLAGATALGPPSSAPSRPARSQQSRKPDPKTPRLKSPERDTPERAKEARAAARKAARDVTAATTEARAARTAVDRAENQAQRVQRDLDDLRTRVTDMEERVRASDPQLSALREAAAEAEETRAMAEREQERADSRVHGLH